MSVKPVAWTPGPWNVLEPHHIIVDAKGKGIASSRWGRADSIDEANARLIASAPELAEALRRMVDAQAAFDAYDTVDGMRDGPSEDAMQKELEVAMESACELLARITPK